MQDATARPRRVGRWVLAALVVAMVAGVAGITAALALYVYPAESVLPARADVIYVIGPPTRERIALAEQLRDEGVAANILISVPLEGGQSADELTVCRRDGVRCEHPEPFTTEGEMMLLDREYGADASAVIITFTPHVSRTRFIATQCGLSDTTVVAAPARITIGGWLYQFAYQTGGFVKAALTACR